MIPVRYVRTQNLVSNNYTFTKKFCNDHIKYHGDVARPFFLQLMLIHPCEAFTHLTDHSLYTTAVSPLLLSHPRTATSTHSSWYHRMGMVQVRLVAIPLPWAGMSPNDSGYCDHPNSVFICTKVWQVVSHSSEYMQPRHTYSHPYFYSFMAEPPIKKCNIF